MFNRQKTHIAALLLGLTAALATTQTFAYAGGCMGAGPMGGRPAEGRLADRMKMHQQRLHDALKLTAQQEPAWSKFQETHPFAQAGQRPAPAEFTNLPAPERAEKMLELQKQHQEAMSKHVAALKEFYGQLTPEQKKTFDEFAPQGRRGSRGAGGPGRTQAPSDSAR